MDSIDLAYVGRGLHEELVAYIADQQDYYAAEGVRVALHDGCDWDEQRLRRGATIGLGRALVSRLTGGGVPWVALTVSTHRPLFWFLARPELTTLADLAGHRLAVHAPRTPPGCFARIVMRRAGLDPDRDVDCIFRPPGDYAMDLRRLHDGDIDAAYIGSTLAPEVVAARHGWRVPAWVGDHLRIPTVGVAVDPTHLPPDTPAVSALVRAHRRALRVIHDDPDTTIRYLRTFLGGCTEPEARTYYETYLAPHFTTDGQVDPEIAKSAIAAVAAELGVPATLDPAEFFCTA
ncbi:ABC transporter substrate-binding protein [Nocardia sp. BMG111209]|uniref:ABC transporter substrate-binding protein n=1 Tax=Nocardia sp. BMG111209 TaxID=1160137 RepID=UPI0003738674|nr:ABC transporter substrate-binding protein [Nocardia sp. BMG111209]